jgi:hypothetical protein
MWRDVPGKMRHIVPFRCALRARSRQGGAKRACEGRRSWAAVAYTGSRYSVRSQVKVASRPAG